MRRSLASVGRKWYSVLVRPRGFFSDVHSKEVGQREALIFVVIMAFISKLPPYILNLGSGTDFVELGLVTVAVVLLTPVLLHIFTAVQYLLIWIVTDEDEGVDRTLRAIGYSTAPAVFSWIPFLGLLASLYGFYLLNIGVGESHGIGPIKATAATILPGILIFGVVFPGFDRLMELIGVIA